MERGWKGWGKIEGREIGNGGDWKERWVGGCGSRKILQGRRFEGGKRLF